MLYEQTDCCWIFSVFLIAVVFDVCLMQEEKKTNVFVNIIYSAVTPSAMQRVKVHDAHFSSSSQSQFSLKWQLPADGCQYESFKV